MDTRTACVTDSIIIHFPLYPYMHFRLLPFIAALFLFGCAAPSEILTLDQVVDPSQLLEDIRTLSSAEMEGRRPNTPGHDRAQEYIVSRFAEIGIDPLTDDYRHEFSFLPRGSQDEARGVNIMAAVRGTEYPDRYIVITAHYDHVGIRNDNIYFGADDNASGTAALFAIAESLMTSAPRHSVILVALDAEEMGLRGARHFVADPPVPLEQIVFNINMDMVSRNENNRLYAVGTYHYPFLIPIVERVAETSPISLMMGYDRPDAGPRNDWTMLSDHAAFHQEGIPFVYFGVEDHDDYHRPTDTFENIDPEFYVGAVETIIRFFHELDAEDLVGR